MGKFLLLEGNPLNQSAKTMSFPGLYMMFESYFCSLSNFEGEGGFMYWLLLYHF